MLLLPGHLKVHSLALIASHHLLSAVLMSAPSIAIQAARLLDLSEVVLARLGAFVKLAAAAVVAALVHVLGSGFSAVAAVLAAAAAEKRLPPAVYPRSFVL